MLAAILLAVAAQAVTVDEVADGLIAEAVQHAQASAKLRYERGLTGSKQEQEYNLRESPERLTADKEFRLVMSPNGLLHQLIELNGMDVSGAPLEPPEIDPTAVLGTLSARYSFRMASPVPVDGCYSVAFAPQTDPKKPVPEPKNEKEMVLNHLSGTICIDAELKYVRRFQAWLEKPFTVQTVGRVHSASAVLEQVFLDGLPVPLRSVFTVHYSKFWVKHTETKTAVTYKYNPLPPPPPVIPTPAP